MGDALDSVCTGSRASGTHTLVQLSRMSQGQSHPQGPPTAAWAWVATGGWRGEGRPSAPGAHASPGWRGTGLG